MNYSAPPVGSGTKPQTTSILVYSERDSWFKGGRFTAGGEWRGGSEGLGGGEGKRKGEWGREGKRGKLGGE